MSIDFLLISDPKIWAMPVEECFEPLVDVRETDFEILANPHSQNLQATMVRQSVLTKLLTAKQSLPSGYNFLFSEGHRPIAIQKRIYEDYYQDIQQRHPDWDKQQVESATSQFVAPPLDVPPHSTGGAFDLTLLDADGQEVDMGSIMDDWPDRNEFRNFTYAKNISIKAQQNRQMLINVLSQVGFINYPAEWWHWSYGDKYWAYHSNAKHAIYGSVS